MTDTDLDDLIAEAALWHRTAQDALRRGDHDRAEYAYHFREAVVRYAAAHHPTLSFHAVRARAIISTREP